MGLKKEELQNKKCLRKLNNNKDIQGKILLVLFFVWLCVIAIKSKDLANFILMLDKEQLAMAIQLILTGASVFATLPVLKKKFEE